MRATRPGLEAATACLLALSAACSQAQPAPTPPNPPNVRVEPGVPAGYADAPEPYRSYLLKARAAEGISDPLQHCLAFPVLPGTKWPAGLIEAHCEYALGPRPSREEVIAHINSGDASWLEKTYRALLDRHFKAGDRSEHIHDLFDYFGGDYESGRLTKRWLEIDPDSAFAFTARGNFYQFLGWAARGEALARDTASEQIEQMHVHHAKARELYQQAITNDPRVLDAYVGLVLLGRNDQDAGDAAFAAARKIDPACKVLVSQRMSVLQPRWGGSYEQMLALEKDILPYMDERPLLALSRVWPYIDMADMLMVDKKNAEAARVLQPMIAVSSSPQLQEDLGRALYRDGKEDRWEVLAYLVAGKRFRPGRAEVAAMRGALELVMAKDYTLAASELAYATQTDPENARMHYQYAEALKALKDYPKAQDEYLAAMKYDPGKKGIYMTAAAALSGLRMEEPKQ